MDMAEEQACYVLEVEVCNQHGGFSSSEAGVWQMPAKQQQQAGQTLAAAQAVTVS
jgi:VCBS repeat-containing protein